MKLTSALFISFILLINFSFAQYDGEIAGKIIDSITGEALFMASISLEQNGTIINQTNAEENGGFYFKPLKSGYYDLRFSFIGYNSKVLRNIYVVSNDLTYLNIQMRNSNIQIGPVTITETSDHRIISPYPMTVIREAEINNSTASDAIGIVAGRIAGVYSPDGGENGDLYIQGSRADATLYVIDGVRVEGSAYIPKNAIAEIIVYTGGIPAKYGDVTGGVVEIRTKSFAGIY